jgi:hypothetical protein
MPFVITATKRPDRSHPHNWDAVVVTRRAAATLEAACGPYAQPPEGHDESMAERCDRANTYDYLRLWDECSGVLRLHDGVVKVERVSWIDLRRAVDDSDALLRFAEIIAAYNTVQETSP